MVEIHGVQPAQVRSWWPIVCPLIVSALAHDGLNLVSGEDILPALERGGAQLWLVLLGGQLAAAATTEVTLYPRGRVLTVVTLGGTGLEAWWLQLESALTHYAMGAGCQAIECRGRKGWGRILSPLGWNERSVCYAKEL